MTQAALVFKKPAESGDVVADRILDFISINESRGDYNSRFKDPGLVLRADLSSYTFGELLDALKAARVAGTKSTAVGKYQFIYKTLLALTKKLSILPAVRFTPEMQDALAFELLRQRGYESWMVGQVSDERFALNLAKEWASLPDPKTGRSVYAGDGLNKSHVTPEQVYAILRGT